MKKRLNRRLLLNIAVVSLLLGILFSCATEAIDNPIESGTTVDGYMKIMPDIPGFEEATKTRAMSPETEKAIDTKRLHLFVFDHNSTFAYQPPIIGEPAGKVRRTKT